MENEIKIEEEMVDVALVKYYTWDAILSMSTGEFDLQTHLENRAYDALTEKYPVLSDCLVTDHEIEFDTDSPEWMIKVIVFFEGLDITEGMFEADDFNK